MGSEELWDQAEQSLQNVLEKRGIDYRLNAGDGAFYGPKIDFHILDALQAKLAMRNDPTGFPNAGEIRSSLTSVRIIISTGQSSFIALYMDQSTDLSAF